MDEIDLKLDLDDDVAQRGDDVNGDGICDFDPKLHDLWFDFNGDYIVEGGEIPHTRIHDTILSIPVDTNINGKDTTIIKKKARSDTIRTTEYPGAERYIMDSLTGEIIAHADLYPNGKWDKEEMIRDYPPLGIVNRPTSGDFRAWEYECYPFWFNERFDFDKNDYGIAINSTAICKNGVADVHLTYPRQLARRLYVTVNAEAKGVRDRDGERFVLPVVVGK
jgi:hypothetical protein